jgi:hypothetical protein
MRFGKLVQLLVGFAAASGAFVLLSSNALAADAGSVTNVQRNVNSLTASTNSTEPSVQNTESSVVPPVASDDSSDADTNTPTATIGDSAQSTIGSNTTTDTSNSVVSTTSNGDSQTPIASTNSKTTTSPDAALTETENPATGDPALDNANYDQSVVQSTPSVTASDANVVQAAPITTDPQNRPQSPTASVVYRSAVLAIQPTILNSYTVPSDLADSLPSAALPAKAPSPAKSNSGLDQLSLVLAGTVVPTSFFPVVFPVDRLKLLLSLATLTVLLGNLIVLSYGVWLRKGGFATAARSDTPAAYLLSSFATPFLLGYVSAPPRMHSPSLMVSDYKTIKTLSSMLSERRKSI